MPKNDKVLERYDELLEDVDFEEDLSPPDEVLAHMITGFVEASNHQQEISVKLTKLVLEKSTENINEEKVFAIFKQASKIVMESFPLKELWEKYS